MQRGAADGNWEAGKESRGRGKGKYQGYSPLVFISSFFHL